MAPATVYRPSVEGEVAMAHASPVSPIHPADPPNAVQAEAHYQQALALAEELGMRPLQAHCHLALGSLYGKTGRLEPARAELSAALDLYHAMDMTFWLPQVEAALARVGAVG
jgi:tetratricopeptide (TPR) repeat protein